MALVILQPCANKGSREHYQDTIQNSVALLEIESYLGAQEREDLQRIYPDGELKIWGVTPGKGSSQNFKRWERIQPGDVTLLAAKGRVFATAVTTYKVHNPSLAEKLWGRDSAGQTWEYIYFVAEVYEASIPYADLNKVIPYKNNYVIQGFSVLNQEQSDNVLTTFNLSSETFYPAIDISKVFEDLTKEDSLDGVSIGASRKEQGVLRRMLFENKPLSNCCICNEAFPVSFLVAAHVKKRSECSLAEKKDFSHIVAPMCKFGCDELYEKGIIGVKDGLVVRLKTIPNSLMVDRYVGAIVGNQCSFFNHESNEYFSWHVKQHQQ